MLTDSKSNHLYALRDLKAFIRKSKLDNANLLIMFHDQ